MQHERCNVFPAFFFSVQAEAAFYFSSCPLRLPIVGALSDFHMGWTDARSTSSASVFDDGGRFLSGPSGGLAARRVPGNIHMPGFLFTWLFFFSRSFSDSVAKYHIPYFSSWRSWCETSECFNGRKHNNVLCASGLNSVIIKAALIATVHGD